MGELKFDPRKTRKWIPLPLGHESHYDFNVFFFRGRWKKKETVDERKWYRKEIERKSLGLSCSKDRELMSHKTYYLRETISFKCD